MIRKLANCLKSVSNCSGSDGAYRLEEFQSIEWSISCVGGDYQCKINMVCKLLKETAYFVCMCFSSLIQLVCSDF